MVMEQVVMDQNLPVLNLVGQDGNAFNVLGLWQRAAKQAGWSIEQIDKVMKEATSGDYDHLLSTILDNSESNDEE